MIRKAAVMILKPSLVPLFALIGCASLGLADAAPEAGDMLADGGIVAQQKGSFLLAQAQAQAEPKPKQDDKKAAAKDDKKPESKPVEGKNLKVPKVNGGVIDIQVQGGGQVMIAPGAIRILPGIAPRVQLAGKAKEDDKDEEGKEGADEGDDEEEKTTEDKIAAFLKKREIEARKPRAEQMQRRIEELEDIVGLKDGQKKKLEIASKGAVEKSLEPWREQMDNYIRQYLERSPNNVDMMLASIGNVNFGHTPEQQAAEQKVWLSTIGRVLDKEQMATYQHTVDERNDYLHMAVSSLLIADLDRNLRLTAEQREKLAGLLQPVIDENLLLLGRWSNDGNLPVYQLPTLLGGVDEKDLKKVLSKKQIEGWQARFARFKNMWQSIEQQKESQRKEAEAKKKEEEAEAAEKAKEKKEEGADREDEDTDRLDNAAEAVKKAAEAARKGAEEKQNNADGTKGGEIESKVAPEGKARASHIKAAGGAIGC